MAMAMKEMTKTRSAVATLSVAGAFTASGNVAP
jgi:hypothetical protein